MNDPVELYSNILRMQETEKNSPRTKQKNNYLHKNTIKPRTRERKKEKEQEEKAVSAIPAGLKCETRHNC
jgi:hypothetical protein